MDEQIVRTYKNLPYSVLTKADYNRPINRKRVMTIKANYDAAEVRPVIVSFRDGRYYVIDGQHTSIALYELNGKNQNTQIYCDVRIGLTYEQEADLYVRLNKNSKPIRLEDEIKGRIEAHDPIALLFRETVEDSGYTLFSDKHFRALATPWNIFNQENGRKRLSETLDLIYDTWQFKKNATHSLIIKGVAAFLDVHSDEYSKDVFVKKLSRQAPQDIINAAQSLANVTKMPQPYALYLHLLEAYNSRMRSGKLRDKYNTILRK